MTIQFNTDQNVPGNEKVSEPLSALIAERLSRFSQQITRIEVHLSDEDGKKGGLDDKRCMLEARLEGRQPISVTNSANSRDQAVKGAINKLKTSLDTILGRLSNH